MKRMTVLTVISVLAGLSINALQAETQAKPEWAKSATQSDIIKVDHWQKSLSDGVEAALRSGHGKEIEKRTPLFSTDIRERGLGLSDGRYHCSITKLGGGNGLTYISYPKFLCMVTKVGDKLQFTKLTGSQMTSGWIYKSTRSTGIYLGTSFYGYEDRAPKYGSDEQRDDVAIVERVGDRRWRMVFPDPYYESEADVMELTPVR